MSTAALVQSAPLAGDLHVLMSAEGATTVVALRGEADIATLPVLVDALSRVIADRDGDVVVDLAQTDFIDTAALRAVLRARAVLHGAERGLPSGRRPGSPSACWPSSGSPNWSDGAGGEPVTGFASNPKGEGKCEAE